ncbi:hypothetical protein C7974DRAFT_414556 [Boeremia exigua]|uniref:uncharacterized protein n=1 Tax=Boeremia exigua TaxID=749465 RepID=UPI001E8EE1FA|nr:uncharacterized protein C7974DRAFT_414556 [Boeremia exigua]KAH6621871.1 hypothetical protein C7974DRAFT_414556 [Boeremia exigua]
MDVRLDIENNKSTFSSGEIISGSIKIFCSQTTTVSELTATLIGESTSSLTGAPGLLFSRREEEKHTMIREVHKIFPSYLVSKPRKSRPLRLEVGCHSFDFRLRVPRAPDCSTCPPDTPSGDDYQDDENLDNQTLARQLPPSTKGLQAGNEVAYRIDVSVITIRNMFRNRSVKSHPIDIWPIDVRLLHRDHGLEPTAAIVKARATVLGPSSMPLPSCVRTQSDVLGLGPAEILITATLQPDFQLVRVPRIDEQSPSHRGVKMDLSITKLNQHPQNLYLQSFQMLLVGYTDIRAGTATHGHMSFWTLQSLSNVGLQIFSASDPSGKQSKIDSRLWDNVVLDESVVPDFATCNLERRYELEILMGWQCQSGEHAGRVFFVQLRTPVRIASGILPSIQTEKKVLSGSERCSQIVPECKEVGALEHVESPRVRASLYAPPTYDEAVRTTANRGRRGSR